MQNLDQTSEIPEENESLMVRPTYEQQLLKTARNAIARFVIERGLNRNESEISTENAKSNNVFDWLESHPTISIKRKRNIKTALQKHYKTKLPPIKKKKKNNRSPNGSATIECFISTNYAINSKFEKYKGSKKTTRSGVQKEHIYDYGLSIFIATAITGLTSNQIHSSFIDNDQYLEREYTDDELKDGVFNNKKGKLKVTIHFNKGEGKEMQSLKLHHLTPGQLRHIIIATHIKNATENCFHNPENVKPFLESITRVIKEISGMKVNHIRQAFPSVLNKINQQHIATR